MQILNVNHGERSYPIYIEQSFDELKKCLQGFKSIKKGVIIADSNTSKLYGDECLNTIRESGIQCDIYTIPAGEENKTLDTVRDIYNYLIEKCLDRSSVIFALGGGVTGDITGFVASTFLRGINFIQIPTTLLSQADSSVGGKVGVDFNGFKNMIGSFYQPKLVYINVNTLKSLPISEIQSGLAETIKHGIIRDLDFFEYVEYNIKKILDCDTAVLQYIAKCNCTIKGNVVEEDEKESGIRAILNFGHTIGHAIESSMEFKMSHGQCIAIGMLGVFKMAVKLGMAEESTLKRVENLLKAAGLPINLPGMDIEKVFRLMYSDKKIKNNRLLFVLPKSIGDVELLTINDVDLIKKVLIELSE
jgi:3-dehydroquinate synthase